VAWSGGGGPVQDGRTVGGWRQGTWRDGGRLGAADNGSRPAGEGGWRGFARDWGGRGTDRWAQGTVPGFEPVQTE
jgi:hypothetical protein